MGTTSADRDRRFSAEIVALTNAFGDPTRREAWLFTRAQGEAGATATQVADHLGLHPNVARHHLDKLTATTYLEVFVARPDGATAGRPSKYYRVPGGGTEPTTIGFTTRRDELVITLLGRALAMLPPDQARAMAEEVGEEYGRRMAADFVPGSLDGAGAIGAEGSVARSFRGALHAVADALTAHGFSAHTEFSAPAELDGQRGDGKRVAGKRSLTVVADHCPFGDAARQHPVLCAVDRGLIRGMLGGLGVDAHAAQDRSKALGDATCATTVLHN